MTETDGKKIGHEDIKKRKEEILRLKRTGDAYNALAEIENLIEDLMFRTDIYARLTIGWLLHERGVAYQSLRENWEDAREWLSAAFAYRSMFDSVGAAYTIFQIAMLEEAFPGDKKDKDIFLYFLRAKPYIVQIKDILSSKVTLGKATDEEKLDLGNMLHNLAYIFQKEGDKKKAMRTYQAAFECRRQFGDKRGEALTLARMAEVEDNFQKANEYLDQAEKIFQEIGDVNRLKQIKKTREEIQKRKIQN